MRTKRTWLMSVAFVAYVVANILAIRFTIRFGPDVGDWPFWRTIPSGLARGDLYAPQAGPPFVWSPVAAWIMAAVTVIGYWPWVALHIVVLGLLRRPALILLALASWAFWWDAASAHTTTFVFVAAVLALRGSRAAGVVYLGLFLLMPRPLQLPIAVMILWRMPETRVPAAVMFAGHALLVLLSGYLLPWLHAALAYQSTSGLGIGPNRYLGDLWLVIALPIGLLIWWRGRPGIAGVVLSPYLLPQYLLLLLADVERPTLESSAQPGRRAI